jgi:tRNA (guanine37-N1)-methyltransferase
MKIDIVTIFPELLGPFKEWSMIKKAREIGALDLNIHNLRDWAVDKHGTVDSRPYGGGPGMVLRPEPIYNAIQDLIRNAQTRNPKTLKSILLSPKGKLFNQKTAEKLSKLDEIILICGHYEGVDERIRKHMVDLDLSIGNYVLSGGEIPAMAVTDAISRLLPDVLEKKSASEVESFSPGLRKLLKKSYHKSLITNHKSLLEFPHYTRPKKFKNWEVPDILLSGDHQKIAQWRAKQISSQDKND